MRMTPRKLRLLVLGCSVAVAVLVLAALWYVASRPVASTVPRAPEATVSATEDHVPPAPLLIVPLLDQSGSMEANDPAGLRFKTTNSMLDSVVGARPAPARTDVLPIYFGTSVVPGELTTLSSDRPACVVYGKWLGDTDFGGALTGALPGIASFRKLPGGATGRVICVIVTDGAPDLPGSKPSAASLWPGIELAVRRVREVGAEVYLLGVADGSSEWKSAAARWRELLGSDHVLLANTAGGLEGLYADFAHTALDLGLVPGKRLDAGTSMSLQAGRYSDAMSVRITALEPNAACSVELAGEASSTPVALASPGEQITIRYPVADQPTLRVSNTGNVPVMVAFTPQTAALQPQRIAQPVQGAPVQGVVLSLRDGRGRAMSSQQTDPLELTARLDWLDSANKPVGVPLDLRHIGGEFYEASAEDASWPDVPVRLTVLSRSVAGELGRADYSLETTSAPWGALTQPVDLFALNEAKETPLEVRIAEGGSRQADSTETCLVSAQLLTPAGTQLYSSWLQRDGSSYRGALPGDFKDGVLRLVVVGSDGTALSSRDVVYRMRKTPMQRLLGEAASWLRTVGLLLLGLVAVVAIWVVLKPPLAGSLLVKGAGRPQRITALGRRWLVTEIEASSGNQRVLLLPATRNAIRVWSLGLLPRQVVVHRGEDVPFVGRIMRLV